MTQTSEAQSKSEPDIPLRPADSVMRLDRMGSAFQTRLSFMRSLIRRMSREGWSFERVRFDLDKEGYGTAVYRAVTPKRVYSLICFSHYLAPDERTDRVIAEAWDATFSLYDGIPSDADIERLRNETPRQEAGRYLASELVMSRANKSLRLFEYVTGCLSNGRQPDPKVLGEVGYLMRTTAVYGNGKFGMSDRERYLDRAELASPFRAELLSVYMIRNFTLDLIEHLARQEDPEGFVPLDPRIKRYLGIGNATGLGMAPFLISHPALIHNWYHARETALARVRSLPTASTEECARFKKLLQRATQHVAEWQVEDSLQTERIAALKEDLAVLHAWCDDPDGPLAQAQPWNRLFEGAEAEFSLEGQELLVSLLLEPYPDLVNDLGEALEANEYARLDPTMTTGALRGMVEQHYAWALAIDYSDPKAKEHFWYSSEEKLEPRRGLRYEEPGAEKEMPLTIACDVQDLHADLKNAPAGESLAAFLMRLPQHRGTVRRVQRGAQLPYSEIRENLLSADCRPIDILRSKLAYFGASKFDPKSDLWTRITMYQGAPLPDELGRADVDDWCFPVLPVL